MRIARKIGTFETSILPYEDCCTVFTPRHPKTKPKVEDVAAAEAALDMEGLVAEALEGIERIWIDIEGAELSVGTELLLGSTINTDAADVARAAVGIRHRRLLADRRGRQPRAGVRRHVSRRRAAAPTSS